MNTFYIWNILIFQLFLLSKSTASQQDAVDISEPSKLSNEVLEKLGQELDQRLKFIVIPFVYIALGNMKLTYPEEINSTISEIVKVMADEATTLFSLPTINEGAHYSDKKLQLPNGDTLPNILKSNDKFLTELPSDGNTLKNLRLNVADAITRTLIFYSNQLDEIQRIDTTLALIILREIDNKHGGTYQKSFPMNQWIQNLCEKATVRSSSEGGTCKTLDRQWKNRSESKQSYWKSASIINRHLNQTDDRVLKNIGNEKDEQWGMLIGQCQLALLNRCEIPYVCDRTLLDPTPRSQYHLTHQLLQRIFIENVDCPSNKAIKAFVTEEEMYTSFCSKIYLETKYLDILDVPPLFRDLFSEMVGLCGYMGYSNFLREDWINRILSWQSKSESGCFIKSSQYPAGLFSLDAGFKRQATRDELKMGVEPMEKCLPHFTATSLMALATYYDYLMDSQYIL